MSFLVDTIAQAIATFEGYYIPGSLSQRNNNPGNLRSWGGLPTRDGYASFPTPEDGWRALRRQIELNIGRGLTLDEFFGGKEGVYAGYAPAADNNQPGNYARYVADRAGVAVDVPLNQVGEPPGNPMPGRPLPRRPARKITQGS
jgi:hypothetical protein